MAITSRSRRSSGNVHSLGWNVFGIYGELDDARYMIYIYICIVCMCHIYIYMYILYIHDE